MITGRFSKIEGVSKANKITPCPLKGFSKILNIRKSPLGDLGVGKEKQAFKIPAMTVNNDSTYKL